MAPDSMGAALVIMGHKGQSPALTGEISPGKPETMTQMELWREAAPVQVSGSISLKYLQICVMKTEKNEHMTLPFHFIEWRVSKKKTSP